MFRGPVVFATLAGVAQSDGQFGDQCQYLPSGCAFNVTALEEFSADYTVVTFTDPTGWTCADSDHGCRQRLMHPPVAGTTGFTTSPLPDTFPSEHGTIAVHARNLQLKLDSHAAFPTPFALGSLTVSGMQIHEELHINGATGQASFHLESPIVNLCFQLDHLPPVTQQQHDMIDGMLQQAEQMGPQMIHHIGYSMPVDGEQTVGFTATREGHTEDAQGTNLGHYRSDAPGTHWVEGAPIGVLFTADTTHPKFVTAIIEGNNRRFMQGALHPAPADALLDRIALKFDNYASSVGNQFSVRACEIESQTATQSLLATNPEAREFLANRISQHQKRLQALLEPVALNTRFNFIPLEIADLMIPAAAHCANDELAEIPGSALTTLQVAAFSVCSFVMGVTATFAVLRKKTVTLADDYHQVSA